MTDPFTVGVASFTAALACVLGWMMWPHPPDLEGERWFKVMLASLLRGRHERSGHDAAAWVEAVVRQVPYHPAGRLPERKVVHPDAGLPGAALDGERALCERLAALGSFEERWAWMYDRDEAGLAVRLDDPTELGPSYEPSSWLGPSVGWDALAAWGAGTSEDWPRALARQVPATWVLVDGRHGPAPLVLGALARRVPDVVRVPWSDSWADPQPVLDAVAGLLGDPTRRFVFVGAEVGIQRVLRALTSQVVLRDRTLAVVSVGGALRGLPGEDGELGTAAVEAWMNAWFTHHRLDTEVTRKTPYLSVQWLNRAADPPGAFGVPLASARFPEPKLESMTQEYVQVVDLGVLPSDSDPDLVACGLWSVVTCWVAAAGR